MTALSLFFESCAGKVTGASYLPNHLRKFGLEMHLGSGAIASKTEATCCPPMRLSYDDGDTTPFTVLGPNGEGLGFVSFTKKFKYLGSLVNHSLTSGADVNKRVKSAAAAFGSPRSVLCSFVLSEPLRGAVYSSLVLTTLLYKSIAPKSDPSARTSSPSSAHSSARAAAPCAGSPWHSPSATAPHRSSYKRLGIAHVASTITVVYSAGPATCRACL